MQVMGCPLGVKGLQMVQLRLELRHDCHGRHLLLQEMFSRANPFPHWPSC